MHPSAQRPLGFAPDRIGPASDRRTASRLAPEVLGLDTVARLDQGIHVRVLNVSAAGALVEQQAWVRPGTDTALSLMRSRKGDEALFVRHGSVVRCWVHQLTPLVYRTAIHFDRGPAVQYDKRRAG
jgi:hypothetical protein